MLSSLLDSAAYMAKKQDEAAVAAIACLQSLQWHHFFGYQVDSKPLPLSKIVQCHQRTE